MGWGKKLGLGLLAFLPLAAMVLAVYALVEENDDLFIGMIVLSGVFDTAIAAFFIPHVHDNQRLKGAWRILWVVGLGIPYVSVALFYWAIYMLPEKPEDRAAAEAASRGGGGAWYADPWGEAPYRWWDGSRWTDWVTGPPPG